VFKENGMSAVCIAGGNTHRKMLISVLMSQLEIVTVNELEFKIIPLVSSYSDIKPEAFKFNEHNYPTLKEGLRNPKIRRR